MTDDRPRSSEEMIREALEDLSKPPASRPFEFDDVTDDSAQAEQLRPDTAPVSPRRSRDGIRRRRVDHISADPRPNTTQGRPNPRALTFVVTLALGMVGIALVLVFAAANAP